MFLSVISEVRSVFYGLFICMFQDVDIIFCYLSGMQAVTDLPASSVRSACYTCHVCYK